MPFIKLKSLDFKVKNGTPKKNGLSRTVFESNGDSYCGEWKDNLKDGFGTQVWKKENLMYTGYWCKGKRCGGGMLYPVNRKGVYIYNGEWKNDKRDGQGVQFYSDGGRYDGNWKKDKRDGYGRMQFTDGTIYDGTWLKDMRSGTGILYFADGSVYFGEWKKDMKCGQGTMTTNTEDVYEGFWKKDMKHGEGIYYSHASGAELDAVWLQDIPCCGTLEIVNPDAATSPMRHDIPECTLKDPKSVIENARNYYMDRL